jgi:regulatory protein
MTARADDPRIAAADAPPEGTVDRPAIRRAAMDLLARREHSLDELRRKLGRRFPPGEDLDQVLNELVDQRLQSDQRYADSFVRQRLQRGYGPLRLQQEMRQKGLDPSQVAEALQRLEVDWFALAAEVQRKKFGAGAPRDLRDKARRLRFLQYRGFTGDQVAAALDEVLD